MRHTHSLHSLYHCSFFYVFFRHHAFGNTCFYCSHSNGKHSFHGLNLSIQSQFSQKKHPIHSACRNLSHGLQYACRYWKIKSGSLLPYVCRRKIHRNVHGRNGNSRVFQRDSHPLAGFFHLSSQPANHNKTGQTG